MKSIIRCLAPVIFALFILLSRVVAVAKLPSLMIPVHAALAAGVVVFLVWRFLR